MHSSKNVFNCLLVKCILLCMYDKTSSLLKASIELKENDVMSFQITNLLPKTNVCFLSMKTPFSSIASDIFQFESKKSNFNYPVDYIGPHTKYVLPRTSAYGTLSFQLNSENSKTHNLPVPSSPSMNEDDGIISLEPGETIQGETNYLENYYFHNSSVYKVRVETDIFTFPCNTTSNNVEYQMIHLITNSISVHIPKSDEDTTKIFPKSPSLYPQMGVKYTACDENRMKEILLATEIALVEIEHALASIHCISQNVEKSIHSFTTWFGTNNLDNYKMIQEELVLAKRYLKENIIHYDCTSCTLSQALAYVHSMKSPATIYLCPAFWKAPNSRHTFDSQAGTIVHEISHLRIDSLGAHGTLDHVYGRQLAMKLAAEHPQLAKENADNLEYFVESKPYCDTQTPGCASSNDDTPSIDSIDGFRTKREVVAIFLIIACCSVIILGIIAFFAKKKNTTLQ